MAYDHGVKKGILKPEHNFENDIIEAARNIAKRYHTNRNHTIVMEQLALTIFDKLKNVHGLGRRERLLLQIAVLLHDCGKYINMSGHPECSYNIIMATEMIGLSHLERELVANVVRFNSGEILSYEELAASSLLGKEEYMKIAKLTAILRVANALDRSHRQKIREIKVTLKDNHTMQILVDTTEDLTLEQALFGEKAEFFEEVYSIRPVLKGEENVVREEKAMEKDYKKAEYYENRELSWLGFDERILGEARDKTTPLFERLKFLSITASNLDEFFMVRVASLKDMVNAGYTKKDLSGMTPEQQLDAIHDRVHSLVNMQYSTWQRSLLPGLRQAGLCVISDSKELSEEQKTYVDHYFMENVYPVLTPMAVDSSRPFPLIVNKTLNLGALLKKRRKDMSEFATVQVSFSYMDHLRIPAEKMAERQ